ncbi:MAG: thioredoxin family protein [Candidatus Omnitrophica bacterium]|nr:thioredoxin family protein [Candidatus Omnitrophota bacterium]
MDISSGTLTFLGVFLMGLGLNLTPCVYPMLSVTVALFGGSKEIHRSRAFLKACVYVLGMATMYSFLGVGAALLTGDLLGAWLEKPLVLIAIAAVLTMLALGLFGVYVFRMPSWLMQWIGTFIHGRGRSQTVPRVGGSGLFGIYLVGFFVGFFAAPCIGPPMAALLTAVGTKGDPLYGFWIFFVMSLGLGLPYLFFGMFSSLLHKIPKSGIWLVWIERLFGVIVLALAAYYFLAALLPSAVKWLPVISLLFGGVYLGFIEKSGNESKPFAGFKKAAGTLAIAAGLLFPFFAPLETVVWQEYSEDKLRRAKETERPVIIEFFASWCAVCHEMDFFTYSDSRVIQALEPWERLKVDATHPDSLPARSAIDEFDVSGVPTVILLNPDGGEIREARIDGFISASDLLTVLRCAVQTWEQSIPFDQCR